MPLSKFGLYSINDIISDPIIGFSFGGKYTYKFASYGIGVFSGLDFIYNGIDKDFRKEVENYEYFLTADPPKFHSYYNIPFSTGLSYDFLFNNGSILICDAGLILNILHVTDLDLGQYRFESDLEFNLGGKIGVNFIVNNRISLNLNYYGLGKHNILVKESSIQGQDERIEKNMNVHVLVLAIGINFGKF